VTFLAGYAASMKILDEPTVLPEGTVLDLIVDDGGDNLDELLHTRLRAALDSSQQGRSRPALEFLAELRTRR
jgi:hypothetical protein